MRQAYFTYGLTLDMTLEDALSASHQGQCDEDVKALMRMPHIRAQLDKMDAGDVRRELREYGAWEDDELNDAETNLERLVWLGAGDIAEEAKTRHPRMMRKA